MAVTPFLFKTKQCIVKIRELYTAGDTVYSAFFKFIFIPKGNIV